MTLIDELRAAADGRDPILYYDLLVASGNTYAKLAKGVVTATDFPGYVARAYANITGQDNETTLTPSQWFDLSVKLMKADLDQRDTPGGYQELTWQQIRDYHVAVFQDLNLPPEAWTAYTPLATATDKDTLWQEMLESGSFTGNLQATIGAMLATIAGLDPSVPVAVLASLGDPNATIETFTDLIGQNNADIANWIFNASKAGIDWALSDDDGLGSVKSFSYAGLNGIQHIGGSDASNDLLEGTSGKDLILGYKGDDTIMDDGGDDKVYGGQGHDKIFAGAGNDYFDGDFGDDTDDGSVDELSFELSTAGVRMEFGSGTQQEIETGIVVVANDGEQGIDRFRNVEKVYLSPQNDVFVYSDNRYGMDLRQLRVIGGDNTGMGDIADFSQSGAGVESVSGQVFTALAEFDDNGDFEGMEALATAPLLWLSEFEMVFGSSGFNELQLGSSLWFAHGGGGYDSLAGYTESEDMMELGYNSAFEQVILGGDDDDFVLAGELAERMVGHDADVTLVNGDIELVVDQNNFDFDILSYERSAAGVSVTLQNQANVSAILSGGYAEGDEAYGFNGIFGSAYQDNLKGNSSSNYLVGGSGNDSIWGYAGNDTIEAGSGVNEVWTGIGKDLVRVNPFDGASENTTVHDFVLVDDHLDIDRGRITNFYVENYTYDADTGGRFILPGLASLTLDDGGVIALNITGIANGYETYNIFDWSIFA
jgi:Ca2+-binding RTX toxin-like protein